MTDLPSREAVTGKGFGDLPRYLEEVLLPIALAWQSGRLVDREAIDEVWLCIEQIRGERRISNLPANEGHCFFGGTDMHLSTCGRFALVAAAIGGSK